MQTNEIKTSTVFQASHRLDGGPPAEIPLKSEREEGEDGEAEVEAGKCMA